MINKKIIKTVGVILTLSFMFYAGFLVKDTRVFKGQNAYAGEVYIGHNKYSAYLSDDEIEREKGLGGRKSLSENEVMVFLFERPDKYGIWMKDMNFPIDILWVDDSYKTVYIKNDASPNSYPEVFSPNVSVHMILEANSNFVEKNNLKIGDEVVFKNF